ncbi:MAG: type II secretion system protein [Myxococcaceae bacterium]|nr:type II secretion system protein [Myxococcaceae bacterium]
MRQRAFTRSGFTLLELIIVIAIVGLLMGGAVMSMGALTGSKAKSSATELAGTIRLLYDSAALTGRTCRLVFELPSPKDDDTPVKYHAECAKTGLTARKDRDDELREWKEKERDREKEAKKREEDQRFKSLGGEGAPTMQELLAREKQRVEDSAKYDAYSNEEIAERALPDAVRVTVWTRHQRDAVKSGTAYMYFFPQGFTERAQIGISQGNNVWTLTVQSLTGKVAVVPEELEVPKS